MDCETETVSVGIIIPGQICTPQKFAINETEIVSMSG